MSISTIVALALTFIRVLMMAAMEKKNQGISPNKRS